MLCNDIFVYCIKNAPAEEVNTLSTFLNRTVVKFTELTTYLQTHKGSSDIRLVIHCFILQISLACRTWNYCVMLIEVYYSFDDNMISFQHFCWFPRFFFEDFKYWVHLKVYYHKCLGTDALKCFALPDFPPS